MAVVWVDFMAAAVDFMVVAAAGMAAAGMAAAGMAAAGMVVAAVAIVNS